jgi:gliding motility-associated lipoprotein GldH
MLPLRQVSFLFLSLFTGFFFSGCDSKRYFEENKTIPGGVWNTRNMVEFAVDIRDTAVAYNLYLNVRNSGDYPYSNLYVFIHTLLPGGRTVTDTVECQLADYTGRWIGSGIGSVKFNRFLFQEGVYFRRPGKYLFRIEQAMRDENLVGIRDVGLRIERTNP